jgi:hypothetical protein
MQQITQSIVDVLLIALMLGFLWLVLKELALSQKDSEKCADVPRMLCLALDLKHLDGKGWQRIMHNAETLEELQEYVNSFAMFRIMQACVWTGTTMTHVMNPLGVLEPV